VVSTLNSEYMAFLAMKTSRPDLLNSFLETLRSIPGVEAEQKRDANPRGFNAMVWAKIGEQNFTLLIEEKRSVYPRDVYLVLHQLQRYQSMAASDEDEGTDDHVGNTVIPIVAANSISAGAQDILRKENIAFFDGGGSLFLAKDGLFINIVKPPAPS
jgi:hypothetical protein